MKKSFGKGLVDDGGAILDARSFHANGSGVRGKKIAAVEKRKLHGVEPAGRDVEEMSDRGGRWTAINGDGIVVGVAREESAVGDGQAFDAGE